MRELMRRFNHPHEERGVTAIFFGLAIVVLIAGLGLSIDIGNVAYQRNRAQNAVDNAARDLARSCAKAPTGAECAALQASATSIAGLSFDGGTVVATRPAAGKVKVTVEKEIDTPLLSAIGITSKSVAAEAVASSQSGHPTEGYPVLPLGVGYCTWKNHSAAAGTATETSDKIALRTDTLQAVKNLLSPLTSGLLAAILPVDTLLSSLLGVGATESCTHPSQGQLLTLSGAVWLTGENVLTTALSGLFSYNAPSCKLRVGSDLLAFVGAVEGSLTIPTTCTQKFGVGKDVAVGKTIMLPIYVPRSNLQNAGINLLGACVGLSLLSSKYGKTCVEVPPKIGVDIVGYAPFKITGWTYPGTPSATDSSVPCVTKTGVLDLGATINSILTLVEWLLNVVGSLLAFLLGPSSKLTFSLACNGLQGYFTKSFSKDPNFQYSTGGADFGANYVKLTE